MKIIGEARNPAVFCLEVVVQPLEVLGKNEKLERLVG